tara:strand:- start:1520 stop:2044 length:525 start_codon:yes stop_codon:yes gene_type:complete
MEEVPAEEIKPTPVSTSASSMAPSESITSNLEGSSEQIPRPPPQTQFIQTQMQPMAMAPQQVVYIPLKFTPQTNYRTISYIVLVAGFFVSIMLNVFSGIMGSSAIENLASLVCCGSFTGVVFLDASYYKSKADWELAHGIANGGTKTNMVLEIILGTILALWFLLMLLGAALEL